MLVCGLGLVIYLRCYSKVTQKEQTYVYTYLQQNLFDESIPYTCNNGYAMKCLYMCVLINRGERGHRLIIATKIYKPRTSYFYFVIYLLIKYILANTKKGTKAYYLYIYTTQNIDHIYSHLMLLTNKYSKCNKNVHKITIRLFKGKSMF